MEREPEAFDWNKSGASSGGSNGARPPARKPISGGFDQFLTDSTADKLAAKDRLVTDGRKQRLGPYGEPVSYDVDDLGFQTIDVKPKGRASRAIGPIIFLVVFVGLVGGAIYVADKLARDGASGLISSKIAGALEIEDSDTITVDLGEGLFITQAFSGTIDNVRIGIPSATIGGFTGALAIDATGVPTDQTAPAKTVAVILSLDEASSEAFASEFKSGSKSTVEVGDNSITVASKVKAGGSSVPVAVAFTPSAAEGALVLTPQTITVSDEAMTVAEYKDSRYYSAAKSLIKDRVVCVAGFLPETLALTGITASPGALSLAAAGTDVRLSGTGLSSLGSCETD